MKNKMKSKNKILNFTDVLSYWLVLLGVILLLIITQSVRSEEYPEGNLVSADWLFENLNNEKLHLLDASPEKMYMENHIKGAINVNPYAFGVRETPIEIIEQLFQQVGISENKILIIYDQGGAILATRMFFSLYYHGFPEKKLYILDGGLSKWKENGYPLSKEVPVKLPAGTFKIKNRVDDARVKLDEFLSASGDLKNNVLLESLGSDWHFGKTQFFDRAGHIPNSIMMPSEDFFNLDKTFKTPEEVEKMLSYLGINPNQKILTHCGGGVAASVPFFVLKFLLKYPVVKLFMESQMGWLADERGLPFWTYDAPYLMRETDWLKTWGGKMLRMYGIANVSIIDIRPSDQYSNSHLPFSVNIPVDTFRNNINYPENLQKILGNLGIDKNHEAVIFSGSGITKESALVYFLLEYMGQQKVSIYMDSMEKCTEKGFTPTKESYSLEPTDYSPIPRTNLITNSNNAISNFPLIFVNSGKSPNSKVTEGKFVHIDHKEFLETGGFPKEAKNIWDIISNAGISRYSQIICLADDPGESAVNYFIFKLMGFPDVKIQF